MPSLRTAAALLCLNLALVLPGLWRVHDAPAGPNHTCNDRAPAPLPRHLQWVRELPQPRPAWPDQPALRFDACDRLLVHRSTLFVPSARNDGMTAYDAATGAERWHFPTDAPVRFAPVAWEERLYFVADDGYLYCVDAAHGHLLWKFRGGPSERKLLGNERLISIWPARGAPVVATEGGGKATVYFAAGIWPFMGIFLHALDGRTGKVVWTNDGDGSLYMRQPHQTDSFAGVAPQGPLVVAGDRLLVPGRSVPACYDRHTGKLLHYRLADGSKRGGGWHVLAHGDVFFNGGGVFDLANGNYLGRGGALVALDGDTLYSVQGTTCRAHDLRHVRRTITYDRKGRAQPASWNAPILATVPLPAVTALTAANGHFYVGTKGQVIVLNPLLGEGQTHPCWETPIDGTPAQLVVAEGRLFVNTLEGHLYCFGPRPGPRQRYRRSTTPLPAGKDAWTSRTSALLQATGMRDGYCVCWGAGEGRLVAELLHQSRLHVIVIEPDAGKVARLRAALIDAGLYGTRAAVLPGSADTVQLPPYFASLMVSEDLHAAGVNLSPGQLGKLFAALRPFGGTACLPIAKQQRQGLDSVLASVPELKQARLREVGAAVLLVREGPLPGSADWTHEHGDAANTRVAPDRLVKAPLGLLWFGGPSHDGVLPRHGHGPQPQVIEGRLLIEGVDFLRALDIYTGRLLWQTALPGLGRAYDNLAHQPGANAGGGNYVSTPDGIYVAYRDGCLRLDPATGRRLAAFRLPPLPGERQPPTWAHLTVAGAYLIAATNPSAARTGKVRAVSSSKYLTVLDRYTGRICWSSTAHSAFRHNTVCIGSGRLYVIDRVSIDQLARLQRHGAKEPAEPRLLALDLATGREIWQATKDVFGTWLSYSEKHDVLVEAGRLARDTLFDEPPGMRAYQGRSGKVLWYQKRYLGPAMIHGDEILRDRGACDLLTGAVVKHPDPLTGKLVEWTWTRNYGCNTPSASENLLTFRSGAAGYYDLCHDGGTGNLGGFRSSCTNNLIVAGGVLTAPDYTRSCTCSYQNQTSLALVPMADAEMWTFSMKHEVDGVVRRLGVNLGAPGSRKADDGTLWLEYPPAGGPTPKLNVRVKPAAPQWFRHHSARIQGGASPSWVAASGAKGLTELTITLSKQPHQPRRYTVRLHFAEPDGLASGQRRFDVALQGRTMFRDLDVSREAGGSNRSLVKEYHGIAIGRELTINLKPTPTAPVQAALLCGVEIIAEGW